MKWKKLLGSAVLVVVVVAGGLLAYGQFAPRGADPVPPVAGVPADLNGAMSHGEYLAKAADCVACHTARDGGKPYAGGRAFALPFGTIYATNLTPDKDTGIGNWSDDAFVAAVREGIGSHGRLYPAMPYTSYVQMSRQDVLDIKKYLMTLEPVKQATPANTLSFPFNQRWGMAFWNAVFLDAKRYQPDAAKSEEWNRGAYLAGALGHCGECHTPRNIGFATQSHDYLAGAEIEGWKAYNTTSDDAYGLGDWTDAQLTGYLSRGHAPGRSSAAGPMAEVVEHSLQYLTQSDIHALVTYLRSVSPRTSEGSSEVNLDPATLKGATAVLPANAAMAADNRGKLLFEGDCAGCHQWDGAGRQTEYASLKGSHAVNDPEGNALVQVILNGTQLKVGGATQFMPGFGAIYSDKDIAAISNYVLSHFGDQQGKVTAEQVKKARQQP